MSYLPSDCKQQAQFLKVTETASEPPSPRGSATILGSPANSNELFLFGGEYYNGGTVSFFNDLHIYVINKSQWRKVTSPNSPLPRSGHAWCRGGNAGGVYLFGGEFSSPKQGTFCHYNDFWRLEPSSREWQRIETKGPGPPARSGHRMTYFKNYIIVFGGFQDTSQQTKYLQDLWLYDTQNFVWLNLALPPASQKPDPRSSFSFLPHESGAVLYGGYSRVKANAAVGKKTKGGAQATRTILKPVIHQDTWFLRIKQPPPESPANAPPTIRWERRKRPANAPNPPRAGAAMVYHKSRGISFGGVHDVEESEEGIDSEFFDTLFAWNVDRNRFFPLALRRPRQSQKKAVQNHAERSNKRGRAKADEEDLLRNLAALETKESGMDIDEMQVTMTGMHEPEEESDKPEQPVQYQMPHPRFNAQLAVQDDVLYIYGGTYEHGDREYTFDEMFAIDLGKLDGVKQIFHRDVDDWVASDDEDGGSDEDDEDDEDEEDEEMTDAPTLDTASTTTALDYEAAGPLPGDTQAEEEEHKAEPADSRPHPRPFESLRDFHARTSTEWQQILMEDQNAMEADSESSIKEIRKKAFNLAEIKWWDCREEIMALEDEQEEAGIGEVVSIADRGDVGPGKRR